MTPSPAPVAASAHNPVRAGGRQSPLPAAHTVCRLASRAAMPAHASPACAQLAAGVSACAAPAGFLGAI